MKPNRFTVGVLAKQPTPGKAKTRLGMEVGEEVAAGLYEVWLAGYFDRLNESDVDWVLFVDPPGAGSWFRERYGLADLTIEDQPGGDLGNRLLYAQQWIHEHRGTPGVLLGSDTPDLPLDWIRAGMEKRSEDELLIGPAEDGGYYLLGAGEPTPKLMTNMQWSKRNVLERTLHRAKLTDRRSLLLPEWRDVDTLPDWKAFLGRAGEFWEPYLENGVPEPEGEPVDPTLS